MKQNIAHKGLWTLVLIATLAISSCSISYKFNGASIPQEAKTMSVTYFNNRATLVNPQLSQNFTEGFKDFVDSQVRLSMVARGGDIAFEGEITDYKLAPIAKQADATSAMTRLTITVNVRFTNRFDAEADFEKKFTQFVDFDDSVNFASTEQELVDEINQLLFDQIFNAALANW